MVYVAYQPRRKIQIRPREKLEEKNQATSFKSGSLEVGSIAAITYGQRTPSIWAYKHTLAEQVTLNDCLVTNATQYASETYKSYLILFWLSLDHPIKKILLMNNNVGYHRAGLNQVIPLSFKFPKNPYLQFHLI